mmetsp:Transcript_7862/g.11882  ORF Transcript_7862/g.11882 Transcript_7862/m.11882 type:complete len:145 (-) Transcript_7862:139-573(-)|eukprot:CAMPEP_0171454198 /NCGR_PEP_ID=MMETSP0945-20130129/1585_1 /TAXON_ID=109269 /ORGANISM="Vaucheria litorea, Strain CCMP2940" /LENGTH=144 /DNA_ID=CAMNT_0011979183 /DNA_START=46 /DNA_END=480 /DNA_ORIENTATION=-
MEYGENRLGAFDDVDLSLNPQMSDLNVTGNESSDRYLIEFERTVEARARAEHEAEEAAKKDSEELLDMFYDQRTDRMANLQSTNREKEEQMLREMEELRKAAETNPWARICDLVDMTVDSASKVAKMRSLFIQLKNDCTSRSES